MVFPVLNASIDRSGGYSFRDSFRGNFRGASGELPGELPGGRGNFRGSGIPGVRGSGVDLREPFLGFGTRD
ncbi:MAG: hypothetical protein EA380_01355, partial [Phycisphaeraceae bacterium]